MANPVVLTQHHKRTFQTGLGNEVIANEILNWFDGLGTAGTKNGDTVSVSERSQGVWHQTVLTLASTPVTMTDEAGVVAYGGVKVYDFPAGIIKIEGAVANLTVVKSGAGINATFDGDFGLGTATAGNNNALATTEQDIIPTTATPQAVSGATTATGHTAAAIVPYDGHTTPVDAFLNFLIDDADQDGGGTLLVSGTITITWTNLGDY